jgi:uncharacterized ion transporter superfamily protein YfcC
MTNHVAVGSDLRDRAVSRLKKRRDFHTHVVVFVLFNSFVVGIWAVMGHGLFWPVFLIVFWGIGLFMNAWDVYFSNEITEDDIAREVERLERREHHPST